MGRSSAALKLVENPLDYIVNEKTSGVTPYSDMRYFSDIVKYDAELEKKCGNKGFEVSQLLGKIHSMGLPVEKRALGLNSDTLKTQLIRHNYKQFDSLDFLADTIIKEGKFVSSRGEDFSTRVYLPKWGVFGLDSNTNTICFLTQKGRDDLPFEDNFVAYGHSFGGYSLIRDQLRNALDVNISGIKGEKKGWKSSIHFNVPTNRIKKISHSDVRNFADTKGIGLAKIEYFFETSLDIEIPEKSRVPIQKAAKLFGDSNVFFITDRTSEDWMFKSRYDLTRESPFTEDPIVIGCHEKEGAFLVTRFDSSFEEAKVVRDYVAKE